MRDTPAPISTEAANDALTSGATDALAQSFPDFVREFGTLGQGLLIAGLVLGLVLWLLGRKLARPGVAIGGFIIGGGVGAGVLQELSMHHWMLAGFVIGGVVCCLLAWLLFRVWMGLATAAMLAMVAPAVALIWQGQAPDVRHMDHAELTLQAPAEPSEQATRQAIWDKAHEVYEHEKQQILDVWEELGSTGQNTAMVAAAAGAIGGLLLGLLLPYTAASIQTALVGSVLIFFCGVGLAYIWAPDAMARLPSYPVRLPLIVIGLITAHGIGIQWTLSRRRADK